MFTKREHTNLVNNMDKFSFAIGAISTCGNIVNLANEYHLFANPAIASFTIVFGAAFCISGGLTAVLINDWVKEIRQRVKRKRLA